MIQEFFVPVTEKHVGFYSSAQPAVHRISRTLGLLPKDLCKKTETEEPNVTSHWKMLGTCILKKTASHLFRCFIQDDVYTRFLPVTFDVILGITSGD